MKYKQANIFVIFTLLTLVWGISYSQTKSNLTYCDYFKDFFQLEKTINFLQPQKDSLIVAYDVDSILIKCIIYKWGTKKLKIISVGENINKIKKGGIFETIKDTNNFIIVSKNTIKETIYYRIFCQKTGADGHFGIIESKFGIKKLEPIYGWF